MTIYSNYGMSFWVHCVHCGHKEIMTIGTIQDKTKQPESWVCNKCGGKIITSVLVQSSKQEKEMEGKVEPKNDEQETVFNLLDTYVNKIKRVLQYAIVKDTPESGRAQRAITYKMMDWTLTLLKKNMDYGSSVFQRPVLANEIEPTAAIRVRISDKINRMNKLFTSDKPLVENESLIDTVDDAGCYFALLSIALKGVVEVNKDAD